MLNLALILQQAIAQPDPEAAKHIVMAMFAILPIIILWRWPSSLCPSGSSARRPAFALALAAADRSHGQSGSVLPARLCGVEGCARAPVRLAAATAPTHRSRLYAAAPHSTPGLSWSGLRTRLRHVRERVLAS